MVSPFFAVVLLTEAVPLAGGIRVMEKSASSGGVVGLSGSSGSSGDPVGEMGRGVLRARDCFRRAGLRDVSCKLYHGLRHEILNETARQYVYQDVLDWLEAHM